MFLLFDNLLVICFAQALITEVLKFIRFKKHSGLNFTATKKEFAFDEIPGLKEAGWDNAAYLKEKEADERTFEE